MTRAELAAWLQQDAAESSEFARWAMRKAREIPEDSVRLNQVKFECERAARFAASARELMGWAT